MGFSMGALKEPIENEREKLKDEEFIAKQLPRCETDVRESLEVADDGIHDRGSPQRSIDGHV